MVAKVLVKRSATSAAAPAAASMTFGELAYNPTDKKIYGSDQGGNPVLLGKDLGYTPVNKAGDTMSGPLSISCSNSTTRTDYLGLVPTDLGSGKPGLFFVKEAAANTWSINLWDNVNTNGVLNFNAQNVTWNGSQVVVRDVANTFTKHQGFGIVTLTDAATIAWDVSIAQAAKVTLAGNRTMGAPSNAIAGFTYILEVIQDATGSRTLAWNAVFKWPGGTAPTLTTTANARDLFTFFYDGTYFLSVGSLAFA